jgi:short-subunit dehydrogenase
VLAFSRALHGEFGEKGLRVQVVLPGATATDFWPLSGTAIENLPTEIVMSVDHMVDAALSGFDQGELVTIPALSDLSAWQAFEAARQNLLPKLSRSTPADRYGVVTRI